MPSNLKQKLFYGLHHSKKSESSISAPQPGSPEKAAESTAPKKSTEATATIPNPNGKWQNVQKEPDTAGHKGLPEALRYLSLNDERLRTSTIDRSDPAIAKTRHGRQDSRKLDQEGRGRTSETLQRVSNDSSRSRGVLIGPTRDPFAEGYANKNISRDEAILAGDLHDSRAVRAALDKDRHNTDSGHRRSEEMKRSRRQVAIAQSDDDLYSAGSSIPKTAIPARTSSLRRPSSPTWPLHVRGSSSDQAHTARKSSISQNRNMPSAIPEITVSNPSRQSDRAYRDVPPDSKTSSSSYSQTDNGRDFLVHDSSSPVSLDGVVDLTNTEDTTQYTSYAPPVTHETVVVDTHEIVHQQVTREIHNYDVFHRVLPIMQVEVLPPRHYVPDPRVEGGLIEISPKQILGGEEAHWRIQRVMQEALDNHLSLQSAGSSLTGRRPFTARTFAHDEGDFKAYVDDSGFTYTEQTWIHPPTLEDGGQLTGQTQPFHFGNSGGRMDAFDFGLNDRREQSRGRHRRRATDGSTWI